MVPLRNRPDDVDGHGCERKMLVMMNALDWADGVGQKQSDEERNPVDKVEDFG